MQNCTQNLEWGCSQFRLDWGRTCFQSHSHGCWWDAVPRRLLDWEPQCLSGCWLEVTLSFLHVGFPIGQLDIWQLDSSDWRKARKREGELTRWKSQFFCNLSLEVASYKLSSVPYSFFLYFFGCACSTLKFLGQGLNLSQSSKQPKPLQSQHWSLNSLCHKKTLICALVYSLEASHLFQPILKGRGLYRAWIPRDEGHWGPAVRGLTTTEYQWAFHKWRMIYKLWEDTQLYW